MTIRLSGASGLLSLPWDRDLADWDVTEVPLRDIPVGASRHLVRFVDTDGVLYALKELPTRLARHEYEVLRRLRDMELPAVTVVGYVEQPGTGNSILVTEFLIRSWQYRRLFMRMPDAPDEHRRRLLDAMAWLLADLHRAGVFWGDCSLGNTLFKRDGQYLQAYLVDAETAEVHDRLSDGQREHDLQILVENVAGGLMDVAARLGLDPADPRHWEAAFFVEERYRELWAELEQERTVDFHDRLSVEKQIRRLNELGFAVDEVRLVPVESGSDELRVNVAVAGRRFHAEALQRQTGLLVGEGQARVLFNDLQSRRLEWERELGRRMSDFEAGFRWRGEIFEPGAREAASAEGPSADPVQAFCDFLEVRWLLSEAAGKDSGDEVALSAIASHSQPVGSAATMAVLDAPTSTIPAISHADEIDF